MRANDIQLQQTRTNNLKPEIPWKSLRSTIEEWEATEMGEEIIKWSRAIGVRRNANAIFSYLIVFECGIISLLRPLSPNTGIETIPWWFTHISLFLDWEEHWQPDDLRVRGSPEAYSWRWRHTGTPWPYKGRWRGHSRKLAARLSISVQPLHNKNHLTCSFFHSSSRYVAPPKSLDDNQSSLLKALQKISKQQQTLFHQVHFQNHAKRFCAFASLLPIPFPHSLWSSNTTVTSVLPRHLRALRKEGRTQRWKLSSDDVSNLRITDATHHDMAPPQNKRHCQQCAFRFRVKHAACSRSWYSSFRLNYSECKPTSEQRRYRSQESEDNAGEMIEESWWMRCMGPVDGRTDRQTR